MKKSPGRPRKKITRTETVEIRLTEPEKRAFREAASIAGIGLSTWVRERLRRASVRELEEAGRQIPFLQPIGR